MKNRSVVLAAAAAALVLAASGAHAATDVKVVASGLANPRGLGFAPNGTLYVAEAGRGGTGKCIPAPDNPNATRCYGETGALTRIDPQGIAPPERVLAGLPSMAGPTGAAASSGPVDVDFFGMQAFVVIGWGGDPALRAGVGRKSQLFGTVIRALPNGRFYFPVADVAGHETRFNPAGGAVDSNPYGILALPGRRVVADAGANALLEARCDEDCGDDYEHDTRSATRTLAVLPRTSFGTESVPTSVTQGPDGYLYVGQLTGAPFFRGSASLWRVPPDGGTPERYLDGFTAIVDFAFDRDGTLYVVEIAKGLVPGPGANPGVGQGRLLRKRAGQPVEVALDGLTFPAGVAVGPDGAVYVTNLGVSPVGGQVLRVTMD